MWIINKTFWLLTLTIIFYVLLKKKKMYQMQVNKTESLVRKWTDNLLFFYIPIQVINS